MDEGRDLREVMSRGRLDNDRERGRLDREDREGVRQRWHSGDSLELDDGADLRDSLESGTNMVIQVGLKKRQKICKTSFRFTKIVKTKKKQRGRKKEGSGRSLIEKGERGSGRSRRRRRERGRRGKRRGRD